MPKALVNGVHIYYEVYGRGEPILLIMGGGGSALAWQSQIPTFSQHLRVIAYDNRDCGRSEKLAAEYAIAHMADDALALLQHLDMPSAHVFGVSMGGMIAQDLALRYPEHVRTLILGGTSPCLAAMPSSEKALRALIESTLLSGREAFDRMIWTIYSDAYVAANNEDLWLRFQVEAGLTPPLDSLRHHLIATNAFDVRDRLGEILAPTLVMTGDEDPLVPPENSRFLAEHIPGAELIVYPGARHAFSNEFEEGCNAAVLDFIGRHSSITV